MYSSADACALLGCVLHDCTPLPLPRLACRSARGHGLHQQVWWSTCVREPPASRSRPPRVRPLLQAQLGVLHKASQWSVSDSVLCLSSVIDYCQSIACVYILEEAGGEEECGVPKPLLLHPFCLKHPPAFNCHGSSQRWWCGITAAMLLHSLPPSLTVYCCTTTWGISPGLHSSKRNGGVIVCVMML
jgi:hypothetical protein